MTISVVQLGLVDYATGLRVQQQLVDLRKSGSIGDVLLLLEHTPVITLGRNAKSTNVLAAPEHLARRGVELFDCDRGGDVTFHGPGQIVGYPIFDLRGFSRQPSAIGHQESSAELPVVSSQESRSPVTGNRSQEDREDAIATASWLDRRRTLGAVDYVRRLEEVLIRACAAFEIPTERVKGLTGVWTQAPPPRQQAKIAAIGVHISRAVTSHGFALNVNTDLSYFDLIVPCGITSKPVTSMQKELGREIDLASVADSLVNAFAQVFDREILHMQTIDDLLGNKVGIPLQVPREIRQLHHEEENFLA